MEHYAKHHPQTTRLKATSQASDMVQVGNMNWIKVGKNDFFNVENLAHIWINESVNGFFLMGEMIHNHEEIILSETFDNEDECQDYIKYFLTKNK